MITVAILINGEPIMARSATNVTNGRLEDAPMQIYKVDTGKILHHRESDGAVALAHKLLDTIKE